MTNATEYVQAIQEKLHQKDQGQEEFYKQSMNSCPRLCLFGHSSRIYRKEYLRTFNGTRKSYSISSALAR